MLLILSGAYVDSELMAEFGKLPPAFLPVGNRRLYTHQLAQHGRGGQPVYLTVPGGFVLDEGDQRDLARREVRLYRSGAGLSLGAALHDFLADMDVQGRLDVLYGDTLISDPAPGGRPSAYGDRRYEVGKLAHSVLGLYDHIVAGYFDFTADGQSLRFRLLAERCGPLQRLFLGTSFAGRRPVEWNCYPLMVVLFLSMLPLHADSPLRQQALMANGIRLYLEWREHDHPADGGAQPPIL